jgi:hypothetical protein
MNAPMTSSQHVYEVRPRKDHRGVDLISDVLPFDSFREGSSLASIATGLSLYFIFRELPCASLGHRSRAAQYLAAQSLALD